VLSNLLIADTDAVALIASLIDFLGPGGIERKFDQLSKAMQHGSPLLKKYWIRPQGRLWLGVAEVCRSTSKSVHGDLRTQSARVALVFARVLAVVVPTMPEWKRKEVRDRILVDEPIAPIFIELNTSAHYILRGYQLDWIRPSMTPGVRTAEMIVRGPDGEAEIECKSSTVDSGRKVTRRAFYELCDRIVHKFAAISRRTGEAKVEIHLGSRIRSSASWQHAVCSTVVDALSDGDQHSLPDNGYVSAVWIEPVRALSDPDKIDYLRQTVSQFDQGMMYVDRNPDGSVDRMLTLVCRSLERDHVVKAIRKSLKGALHQFSGIRPARIVCYVPEVTSLEELKSGSALQVMTGEFFLKHDEFLHSVVYVSDPVETQLEDGLESLIQGLTFTNARFRGSFPADVTRS
jgi:hypothetical protein